MQWRDEWPDSGQMTGKWQEHKGALLSVFALTLSSGWAGCLLSRWGSRHLGSSRRSTAVRSACYDVGSPPGRHSGSTLSPGTEALSGRGKKKLAFSHFNGKKKGMYYSTSIVDIKQLNGWDLFNAFLHICNAFTHSNANKQLLGAI